MAKEVLFRAGMALFGAKNALLRRNILLPGIKGCWGDAFEFLELLWIRGRIRICQQKDGQGQVLKNKFSVILLRHDTSSSLANNMSLLPR